MRKAALAGGFTLAVASLSFAGYGAYEDISRYMVNRSRIANETAPASEEKAEHRKMAEISRIDGNFREAGINYAKAGQFNEARLMASKCGIDDKLDIQDEITVMERIIGKKKQ